MREFDNVFTAPHFGFADADDYYDKCSAMRLVERIAVPALIITAEDDPFVPPGPFRSPLLTDNPHIDLRISPHGGHCGFLAVPSPGNDGYWAETQIVAFVEARHEARRTAEMTAEPLEQLAAAY